MSHRRVVRHTLGVQEGPQTIPAGQIVAATVHRDYPDEAFAAKIHVWVETDDQEQRPATVELHGTDVDVAGTWQATVIDTQAEVAWHIYGTTSRPTCGATPGRDPVVTDPAEQPFWRVVCSEDAGHDPSNWNTPHRATGLGRHGGGEFTWTDEEPRP